MPLDSDELRALEPQVRGMLFGREAAQISMAISLKRIADFLTGTDHSLDVVSYARREMEQALK